MLLQLLFVSLILVTLLLLARGIKLVERKRGRKYKVDLEQQRDVFQKYKNQIGNFVPANSKQNNALYSELEEAFKYRLSKKCLYMSLKKNFDYFFPNEIYNVAVESSCSDSNSKTNSSSEDDNSRDLYCFQATDTKETFKFNVDTYFWKEIEPIIYLSKRSDSSGSLYQRRNSLQKNKWSDFVREIVWKNTKLKCTWVFKSNIVNQTTAETVVTCKGYCSQCKASLEIIMKNKTENFIEMECLISKRKPTFNHSSKPKYRMTGHKSTQLAKQLLGQSAIEVRNAVVNDYVQESDDVTPYFVPTANALRQIKKRDKSSKLFHMNVILSLWIMSMTPPFKELIRTILLSPFILYYWSKLQETYYEKYLAFNNNIIISIDATGSIFKQICPPQVNDFIKNMKQKHIFLYVVVAYNSFGSSIPLCQMISTSHTAETIATWLKTWKKCLNKYPTEIVTDDSSALIKAVVETFTQFESTESYLQNCFKVLEGIDAIRPYSFLRLDTSHFIKTLHDQTVFNTVQNNVKFFYIKCIISIKNCVEYKEVKIILTNIITISLNQYEDNRCQDAIQYLSKLHNCEIDNITLDSSTCKNKVSADDKISSKTVLDDWFSEEIKKEQVYIDLSQDDKNPTNPYYFPAIIKLLSRLLKKLPMWSNVLTKYFNSVNTRPSSSNSESYFKNIKNLVLNNKRARVDEFLTRHCQYLSGEVKLGLTNMSKENELKKLKASKNNIKYRKNLRKTKRSLQTKRKKTNRECDSFSVDSIFSEKPSFIENWRGFINRTSKTQKQNKEISSSEQPKKNVPRHIMQSAAVSNSSKPQDIHLLSNGSRFDKTYFINTCAFDSVAHLFAVAFTLKQNIRNVLENHYDLFARFITSIVQNKSDTCDLRNTLLNLYYVSPNDSKTVDCTCNVTYVIDNYLSSTYCRTTWQKICSEISCPVNQKKFKRNSGFVPIDLNIILNSGLQALQDAALQCMTTKYQCSEANCAGDNHYYYDFSQFIAIEFNLNNKFRLEDIPMTLNFFGKCYSHPSVIDFIENKRHYIVHCCLDNSEWLTYDDLLDQIESINTRSIVTPHCIIYSKL